MQRGEIPAAMETHSPMHLLPMFLAPRRDKTIGVIESNRFIMVAEIRAAVPKGGNCMSHLRVIVII